MATIRGVCKLCRLAKNPTSKCKHPASYPIVPETKRGVRKTYDVRKTAAAGHLVEVQ